MPRPLRNDDWDGAPLVVRDHLIAGGENGWLYVIRLHRGYDDDELVTVAPEVVATIPGFDDELLAALGDREVSIENSVAFRKGIVYFANSGGLVQGWDIRGVLDGGTEVERVLRFWVGDDVDASIVLDAQGFLYVAAEYQRFNDRSREVGPAHEARPARARRSAGLEHRRPRDRVRGGGGQLVDPRALRRRGVLLDRRRARARGRPRLRRGAARDCRSARPRSPRRSSSTAC